MISTSTKAPSLKRACLYLRVSTTDQTTENQRIALEQIAERSGWTVAETFVDHGISGSKGRDQRPALDRLLKAVCRREVDVVMAWSVDRLGRSLQDLVGILGELQAAKVDLYLHTQGLDTTTPSGRALFGMLGVFAEFERCIIVERVKAGLQRAKAAGKSIGRPKVGLEVVEAILAARTGPGGTERGKRRIAKDLGVGVGTVTRVLSSAPQRSS